MLHWLGLLCSHGMEAWSALACPIRRWGLQTSLPTLSQTHGNYESTWHVYTEGTYRLAEEDSERWPVSLLSHFSIVSLTSLLGKRGTRMRKHSRAWHSIEHWWHSYWNALLQDWDGQGLHFLFTLLCLYSCLHPSVSTKSHLSMPTNAASSHVCTTNAND